jgi:hypothetical protein
MSLSVSNAVAHNYSVENRLHSLQKKGEKWAMKGIQFDPHDHLKNSVLAFSLFRRSRFPVMSIQYANHIIYDFPLPQEYVSLSALADVLKMASRNPNKSVFIITGLSGKNCIHANLIFINTRQKRVEIFDPLGKTCDAEFRGERDLQEFICRIYDDDGKWELCGETIETGIQAVDYKCSKKREGGGFCRVWVWLVAQLCAEFPEKTMREIVGKLTEFSVVSSGQSINICRGFLAEMREHTHKMMHTRDTGFSKLYLELREAPVQSGKARNSYYASERMAMEYLREVGR